MQEMDVSYLIEENGQEERKTRIFWTGYDGYTELEGRNPLVYALSQFTQG